MSFKSRGREDGPSTVELLRRVPIFGDLKDSEIESLIAEAAEEIHSPGDVVIKDGSWLSDLYIVLHGKVEVRKKGKTIARLGEGQFFGEMAVLNTEPTGRSADIVAVERCKCLKVKGIVWTAFLRKNPDVAIEVIRLLAARLRRTNWALSELQNLPSA